MNSAIVDSYELSWTARSTLRIRLREREAGVRIPCPTRNVLMW